MIIFPTSLSSTKSENSSVAFNAEDCSRALLGGSRAGHPHPAPGSLGEDPDGHVPWNRPRPTRFPPDFGVAENFTGLDLWPDFFFCFGALESVSQVSVR